MRMRLIVLLIALTILTSPEVLGLYKPTVKEKGNSLRGWAMVTKTVSPPQQIMYDIEAGVNFTVNITVRGIDITAIDVVMLMDTSGSMTDSDPDAIRVQAAKHFVNMLEDHANESGFYSRVAVVDFDDDAIVLQTLTTDYNAVRTALDACADANGGTNFETAISAGNGELVNNGNPNHPIWAEILLTDGYDNGYPFWDDVQYAADHGIKIYTIGFGNPDSNTLQQIAQQTGGKYYFCQSASDIDSAYQDIYNELIGHPAIVNVSTTTPFIEEVFPPYVEFVSSSIPPGNVSYDSNGNKHVCWYVSQIMVDEIWYLEYEVKVFKYGHGPPYDNGVFINAMDSAGNCLSKIRYRNWTSNTTIVESLPNPRVFVHGPPVAYASSSVQYASVGDVVQFYNHSTDGWYYSFDHDDEIIKYIWDFGDGCIEETASGTISHIYNAPGNYKVSMTAVDVDNLTDTVNLYIRIYSSSVNYSVCGYVRYNGQIAPGAKVYAYVDGNLTNTTVANSYGFYFMYISAKIGSNLTIIAEYNNTTAQNYTILGENAQITMDVNIANVDEIYGVTVIVFVVFPVIIRRFWQFKG